MENLYVVNLGSNLIEEFPKSLITEWFATDGGTELEQTRNSTLILKDNPVSMPYSETIIGNHPGIIQ